MKFGKLENGYFHEFTYIQTETQIIYSQVAQEWYDNDYKSLNEDAKPAPKDGYWFKESFEEIGNEIIVSYTEIEIVPFNPIGL